jgi:hypothetical protein
MYSLRNDNDLYFICNTSSVSVRRLMMKLFSVKVKSDKMTSFRSTISEFRFSPSALPPYRIYQ